MTPDQRVEMEARVDRAVRRGDLSQARADLVELLESFPDDARLRSRLEAFESTALPGELRPSRPASAPGPESPEVLAERLVQEGDLPGALAAYRRAVTEHPENDLFRERLAELFEQVRMGATAGPDQVQVPPEAEPDAATRVSSPPEAPTVQAAAAELSSGPAHLTAADPGPPVGPTVAAEPISVPAPAVAAPPVADPAPEASAGSSAAPSGTPAEVSGTVPSPGHDPIARLEQLLERLQTRRRQP